MGKENLPSKPKSRFGSLFDDTEKKVVQDKGKEEKTEKSGDKVEITKVFDFAGEVVKVSKQVSADSKEAAKFLSAEASASTTKRQGGLAGVVGSITRSQRWAAWTKASWTGISLSKKII